jgi:Glycosyl transferase family 2
MVRNEEDVIEHVIRHLLAEGVDQVLVADNLSTDRTRTILDRLAGSLPVTVLDDPDPAYRQSEKMTALALRAGAEGATWVIPFDADELWVSARGRLRDHLRSVGDADAIEAIWLRHYPPLLMLGRNPFRAMPWRAQTPEKHGKVAFRFAPDITIDTGNHRVISSRKLQVIRDDLLLVHHYPYRTFGQLVRKTRHGRRALDLANHEQFIGTEWRVHGGRRLTRLAVTWGRMSLRRAGRIRDRVTPSLLEEL